MGPDFPGTSLQTTALELSLQAAKKAGDGELLQIGPDLTLALTQEDILGKILF